MLEENDGLEQKVEQTALRLVNFRPRFKDELIWKLKEKKFPSEIIEKIVNKFEKLKILDDKNLLPEFIRSLAVNRRWSKKRIFLKLLTLHIEKQKAQKAIGDFYVSFNEDELLIELIKKTQKKYTHLEKQEKTKKIIGFLLGRGFNYSQIKKVISEDK